MYVDTIKEILKNLLDALGEFKDYICYLKNRKYKKKDISKRLKN